MILFVLKARRGSSAALSEHLSRTILDEGNPKQISD